MKVYSVAESHLFSCLQNSQPCWVLLAPAASSAPPLLGLFSNQINPSPFSTRHKHSCARALFLHSVNPSKKINEVFHLLFFSIWSYFIIDRYIVCFFWTCSSSKSNICLFVYAPFVMKRLPEVWIKWSMGVSGHHIQLWCKFRWYLFEVSYISANIFNRSVHLNWTSHHCLLN